MASRIEEIRNLVATAKLDRAIAAAIDWAKALNDTDSENMFLNLSNQLERIEREDKMGLISYSDKQMYMSRISYGLLETLNDLDKESGTGDGFNHRGTGDGTTRGGGPEKESDVTKILFLTANPTDTGALQLGLEHSRISSRIQESDNYSKFRLLPKTGVTLSRFQEHIITCAPNILHFSGHGHTDGALIRESSRSADFEPDGEESGIILYDDNQGESVLLATPVLRRMFKSLIQRQKIPLHTVFFNSCYSEHQAKALAEFVPHVIGSSWAVKDDAAIAFATGFYFGLAQNQSVVDACDLGINNALSFGEPEERFVIYKDGEKVVW